MADLTTTPILSVCTTVGSKLADLAINDGQLIFVRDKHMVALDYDGKRTVYNQIQELATDGARTSMLAPVTGLFYFVLETGVLWTYQDKWVQITTPPTDKPDLLTSVTYSELKALRDSGLLVGGSFYRITDYVTTTTQEGTRSAGHPFDIVVKAITENVLDEEAKAIQHEDDEYFADSNLAGWQLWYTLDNDTGRFAWADADNGKGVIYRMIDEWGNDCPYDFKNIQMLDANDSTDVTYYYTFDNNGTDHSLNGDKCYNNEINKYVSGTQRINHIIFKCADTEVSTNSFDFKCYNNTLGKSTDHLRFGRECYGNVFNGMNHLCTFDTKFRNNRVGGETQSIQVGQGATGNTFGANIYYCSFGNYFRNNVLCRYLYYSSFGHYVQNCILGESSETLSQYMRFLTFENNVQYVNLYKTDTTTKTYMENIKLCSGTVGTSSNRIMIEVSELAQKYAITYANNSNGELVKYCDADSDHTHSVKDITDLDTIASGDSISFSNGVLKVNTTNNAEADNTLPITSAGVYTQLGNIQVLLETI